MKMNKTLNFNLQTNTSAKQFYPIQLSVILNSLTQRKFPNFLKKRNEIKNVSCIKEEL